MASTLKRFLPFCSKNARPCLAWVSNQLPATSIASSFDTQQQRCSPRTSVLLRSDCACAVLTVEPFVEVKDGTRGKLGRLAEGGRTANAVARVPWNLRLELHSTKGTCLEVYIVYIAWMQRVGRSSTCTHSRRHTRQSCTGWRNRFSRPLWRFTIILSTKRGFLLTTCCKWMQVGHTVSLF